MSPKLAAQELVVRVAVTKLRDGGEQSMRLDGRLFQTGLAQRRRSEFDDLHDAGKLNVWIMLAHAFEHDVVGPFFRFPNETRGVLQGHFSAPRDHDDNSLRRILIADKFHRSRSNVLFTPANGRCLLARQNHREESSDDTEALHAFLHHMKSKLAFQ